MMKKINKKLIKKRISAGKLDNSDCQYQRNQPIKMKMLSELAVNNISTKKLFLKKIIKKQFDTHFDTTTANC